MDTHEKQPIKITAYDYISLSDKFEALKYEHQERVEKGEDISGFEYRLMAVLEKMLFLLRPA